MTTTGCGCLLARTRATIQPRIVTPKNTFTMTTAVLWGLFLLMAVMIGKKYMYKTKNRTGMAMSVSIGVRVLKCV